MKMSVIIASWNTRDILHECLIKIEGAAGGLSYEVVVVDNGSTDGSVEMVRSEYPLVRLIENTVNLGYSKAVNQGTKASSGEFIVLLNSDSMAPLGSFSALASYLEDHPDVGAVGPQLIGKNGGMQNSGGHAPSVRAALNQLFLSQRLDLIPAKAVFVRAMGKKPMSVDWICGACLVVRRDAFDNAGGMDEGHFLYAEDVEFGLRLRSKGWHLHLLPWVEVVHYGGSSSVSIPEKKLLWLGGLFRLAANRLSPPAYSLFAFLWSLVFLERYIVTGLLRIVRRLRGSAGNNGDAIIGNYNTLAFSRASLKLGIHGPLYVNEFCAKLEKAYNGK